MTTNAALVLVNADDLLEQVRAALREEVARVRGSEADADPWLELPAAAKYLGTTTQALRDVRKRALTSGRSFGHKTGAGRIVIRRSELDAFAVAGDPELARSA